MIKSYPHNLKANQSGFSLVETLVAVTLLLIVMAGPMTILSRSAKSSTFAGEQVQAFFLAQEGVELAQKLRDDLLLVQLGGGVSAWPVFSNTTGPYQNCHAAAGCGLEWGSNTNVAAPIQCTGGTNCRLYYRTTNERSRFTYSATGTTTPFTRRIFFENEGAEKTRVRSVVTWRTGSLISEQRVEVQTYLYNIYP